MARSTPSPEEAFKSSLDFVKKLWSGMNVPGMNSSSIPGTIPTMQSIGMSMPTLSLAELDKRINELKSVETWLNMNASMVHNTIQALEIQRATIATLHSLSSSMAQSMTASEVVAENADKNLNEDSEKKAGNASAEISPVLNQSADWWNAVQEQFKQAIGATLTNSATNLQATKATTKKAKTTVSRTATRTASKTKAAVPSKRKIN